MGGLVVGAGECNLYLYPTCTISGVSERLSGDKLTALNELVVSLATDAGNDLMLTPDAVGAYPIHALLVANSQESIALAMKLFKAEPGLMLPTFAVVGVFVARAVIRTADQKALREA